MQRVDTLAGQRGSGRRYEAMMVHDHRVSYGVDAPSTRPAGQLGKLPRRQTDMTRAIEFLKLLHHHTSCRHVDTQGKRFRGEDDFHQTFFEQSLDDLAEKRDHAGVVRRESLFKREAEL